MVRRFLASLALTLPLAPIACNQKGSQPPPAFQNSLQDKDAKTRLKAVEERQKKFGTGGQ